MQAPTATVTIAPYPEPELEEGELALEPEPLVQMEEGLLDVKMEPGPEPEPEPEPLPPLSPARHLHRQAAFVDLTEPQFVRHEQACCVPKHKPVQAAQAMVVAFCAGALIGSALMMAFSNNIIED